MNEVMTIDEINERFPSEWVLLGDPQKDVYLGVRAGTLLCHNKNREEIDQKAIELSTPKNIAILYTGPVPAPGTATLL